MKRPHIPAVLALCVVCIGQGLQAGDLLFRISGEDGAKAACPSGPAAPMEEKGVTTVDGKFGKALQFGKDAILRFASKGNLDRSKGTVCLWIKPNWVAEEPSNHALFSDDREFKTGNNSLTLWEWHTGQMRFDARDEKDNYLSQSVSSWKAGEWHHVAAAWDCGVGSWLFVDGDLAASKKFIWTPKESESFQFGSARGGAWPTDAVLDDIRIYDCPLTVGQVQRVMQGQDLCRVRYLEVKLPGEITAGEEFEAALRFEAPESFGEGHVVALRMDDVQIASAPVQAGDVKRDGKHARVVIRATVPGYLYPAPGKRTMAVTIEGAIEEDVEKARREVSLRLPKRRAAEVGAARLPPDGGLLIQGEFFTGDAARRKVEEAGGLVDAVPCRLLDSVDCAKTDHGYWENSPAELRELVPGRVFRCVGPQERVTQKKMYHKSERPALAAFSYRLKVAPRPTPHLVVVESINDAERYLEVAIDHPRDSKPAPHLASSGCGDRTSIHLGVTYTGREYPTDGQPYRQTFMIFPKTDAIEVMISGTKRGNLPDAEPAAVSGIRVYEALAPLGEMANPILLPEGGPQRSVSIFFPAINLIFEKYGFTDSGPAMRASTLRLFIDYMRFMGLNRFELRPFQLGTRAYFKNSRFEQAGDLDFFGEALPLMREAGMAVVPRVMYLHCYQKLLEEDEDNFQRTAEGKLLAFGQEGKLPDPLRPQVQKVVLDSIQAMLDACKGYDNVPEVGFDTSIGGLYGWEFSTRTSLAGYSTWNVQQFARETGIKLPDGLDAPNKAYEWITANCWEKWLAWRCASWHRFMGRLRDLARSEGKKLELSVRIMPREEFATEGVPIGDIYRYTGYDPALFRDETDIVMDYFVRINSDRYFNRWWWKPWFYDPQQPPLFRSKEPRHAEMYFNYWEIPMHPWGFRVGPGSPAGRGFFEPLTYCMRKLNPKDLTLFCWFRATLGREFEVREFCRAFRALPAADPVDFDGKIEATPLDDTLWVKWFGDRLAVVNDIGKARSVTLRIPIRKPDRTGVMDAALHSPVEAKEAGGALSVRLDLRPFDLRTLVFTKKGT